MKTRTMMIAAALLLTATSASFAQGSASFAEGLGGGGYGGGYPYGYSDSAQGYYNYAPGPVVTHREVRHSSHRGIGVQR